MEFYATYTTEARQVQRWIGDAMRRLEEEPLMLVGLDCEFTDRLNKEERIGLPCGGQRKAAVLQLAVSNQVLVFQICLADWVPTLLREFLDGERIKFCRAAIHKDQKRLLLYDVTIGVRVDLQSTLDNRTANNSPA